jgi:hypothetical protein
MCGITSDASIGKYFPGKCLTREGPSVFMAKTHDYDSSVYFPVDVVCSAMRAFDMMEGWKLHEDPDALSVPTFSIPFASSPRGAEKRTRVYTAGCFESLDVHFVNSVNALAEKKSLDIVIPTPPASSDRINFRVWRKDTFSLLVAEPQTRSIALWMCGIYPRDLCQLVFKDGKLQDYLRSNGVHI